MKTKLFSLLFMIASVSSSAQLITTIAGTGAIAYGGDGGPATGASFNGNYFAAVDTANGEVYIADQLNHRIRKVDMSGSINTIAGTGTPASTGDGGAAIAADLNWPKCMVRTTNGNIYLSESYLIRRIDAMGIITTIGGNGTVGYTGDGGMATDAAIDVGWGMAADNAGNVYFSSVANDVVRKIDPSGIITTVAGTGAFGYSGDGGPATNALLQNPQGLALDTVGNVFIVDAANFRIRKVDLLGTITTFAGGTYGYAGDGGPASLASFQLLSHIAFDEIGRLYLSDFGSQTVRMIDTSGIISTIAGTGTGGYSGDGGPATAAQLKNPIGITVLGNGVVYIPDVGNIRVRVIDQPPLFAGAHVYTLNVCADTPFVSLDTMMAAVDSNTVQVIRWSTITAPLHGALHAADTLVANTGMLFPSGLTYTPTGTYVGADTFKVRVTDGIFSDSVTVYVNLMDCTTGTTPIMANTQQFSIYPNPAADGAFTCYLATPTTSPMRITVTDVTGRKIKELSATTNTQTLIDLNAPPGVYIITARAGAHSITHRISVLR